MNQRDLKRLENLNKKVNELVEKMKKGVVTNEDVESTVFELAKANARLEQIEREIRKSEKTAKKA